MVPSVMWTASKHSVGLWPNDRWQDYMMISRIGRNTHVPPLWTRPAINQSFLGGRMTFYHTYETICNMIYTSVNKLCTKFNYCNQIISHACIQNACPSLGGLNINWCLTLALFVPSDVNWWNIVWQSTMYTFIVVFRMFNYTLLVSCIYYYCPYVPVSTPWRSVKFITEW